MKKIPNIFSLFLLFLGILLGFTLAVLSTWANLEATVYGFDRRASSPFRGLSCPVMMTLNESKSVYIKVSNSTDQALSPSVRTEISSPMLPISTLDFIDLAPGEEVELHKTINAENIDLGRFIFVKALIYSAYPLEDQENTCGVFILPVRGNGALILIFATALSILCMASGAYLLRQNNPSARYLPPLLFTAALVILCITLSFLGLWIPAAVFIALIILMLVISVGVLITQ